MIQFFSRAREEITTLPEPLRAFGRFSDAYKPRDSYIHWDKSMDSFLEEDYLASIESFLTFLKSDEENVHFYREGDGLKFYFLQGSQKIDGWASTTEIHARACVAQTTHLPEDLLRDLAQKNYELDYCRYSLGPEDDIFIVFDSFLEDCSPFKLYHAFRELAYAADKWDDLLLDRYRSSLYRYHDAQIVQEQEGIKRAKTEFLRAEIRRSISLYHQYLDHQDIQQGDLSYVLLSAAYRVDYLTQPEGVLLDRIERIQRQYFARSQRSMAETNEELCSELSEILNQEEEILLQEFYSTRWTFGLTKAISSVDFRKSFGGEWKNLKWYQSRGLTGVAQSVCDYMVGYLLFNFAPPVYLRELLHLYMMIVPEGVPPPFIDMPMILNTKGQLNPRVVRREVRKIVRRHSNKVSRIELDLAGLVYEDRLSFSISYLSMINQHKIIQIV